jgi:tetratricopeptide (TPR) repeat protein
MIFIKQYCASFYLIILLSNLTLCTKHQSTTIISDVVKGYKKLAKSFVQDKKYVQAIINYQHALELAPQDATLHWKCANLLKEINKIENAIEHYKRAVELNPTEINMRFSLANALVIGDKPTEAFDHYRLILDQRPELHTVLYNYGFALKKAGFIKEAIDMYHKVLELEPHYQHAHFSMGLSYLMLGDFQKGWPEYEWRDNPTKKKFANIDPEKEWKGTQNLENKTLLLVAEQGLGDTFQFIRYAQFFKNKGAAKIVCQVQPRLMDILALCPYIDQLIPQTKDFNDIHFDYYIQMISIPYRCQTTVDTIPAIIPYLQADPELVEYWQEQLAEDKNFKIGICWHGNAQYASKNLQRAVEAKSITPAHFASLSDIKGISFYSLQKVDGLEPLDKLSFKINEFDADFDKSAGCFMDTAAVMKNLDLIITVDTSVAHLAGGLGVPVWVMLPYPADWRWMLKRNDSPWYPHNMRLFRQESAGDWKTVFSQIKSALKRVVRKNR